MQGFSDGEGAFEEEVAIALLSQWNHAIVVTQSGVLRGASGIGRGLSECPWAST